MHILPYVAQRHLLFRIWFAIVFASSMEEKNSTIWDEFIPRTYSSPVIVAAVEVTNMSPIKMMSCIEKSPGCIGGHASAERSSAEAMETQG